jgi:DeoR/GlpR family transcriptional regulator of sugar metabolism
MKVDIPKEILDTNLTLGAKLIYGTVKENPSYDNSHLAILLGVSNKQFNRCVIELEKAGLIKRKRGYVKIVEVEDWLEAWHQLRSLQSQTKIFTSDGDLGKR